MLLLDYMSSLPRKQHSLLYYYYYYYYLDFKLFLNQFVDYVFSPSLKMLEFVVFGPIRSVLLLYCTLIISRLDYASLVWKNITARWNTSNGNLQLYASVVCFSPRICYTYTLERLKLHTLQTRRNHLDPPFYPCCRSIKFFPPLIDGISLRIPTPNTY